MKIAVIGAGLMGSAATKYLVARKEVETVQLVDQDQNRLEQTAKSAKSSKLVPLFLTPATEQVYLRQSKISTPP